MAKLREPLVHDVFNAVTQRVLRLLVNGSQESKEIEKEIMS
jgi:hypothetical protein